MFVECPQTNYRLTTNCYRISVFQCYDGVVHFTLPVIFHVFHLPVNIDMIFIEGHELRTMSAVMTARAEIEKRSQAYDAFLHGAGDQRRPTVLITTC